MSIIDTAYETAIEACLRATDLIMPLWPNASNRLFDPIKALGRTEKDGIANYATIADFESERIIINIIQSNPLFATHSITSEESAAIEGDNEWRWIVDPIDGTRNFSSYGGVVLADLGRLATQFSDSLDHAIVGYNLGYHDRVLQLKWIAERVIANVGYTSCLGSFATGNFRLLQGMMGAYFGMAPTVMDIAAAAALIPAVGGVVTDLAGLPIDWTADSRTYVGAINPQIHEQFLTTWLT